MCGGVGFRIKNIPDQELKKYYSPELIKRFKTIDRIESFFWQPKPILPVAGKGGVQLISWGNKDENFKLPKTGWAKEESLQAGKWDYLHPEIVKIPIEQGYEKKTWFDLPQGTQGIVVKKGEDERVYMITKEASEEYKRATGHDREPLGEKKNYEYELGRKENKF
ncbi:MAG: hypothetical protein NTW06_01920 [Candidatus Falkowbacteria bacterium]|nr:hypothetical protein [Candidatus Falkowbacteria bacterium]